MDVTHSVAYRLCLLLLGSIGIAARGGHLQLAPPQPGPRAGHSLVYDAARGAVLLVDGYQRRLNPPERGDLWMWDGRRWEAIHRGGPPVASLSAAVYDRARNRVVLFGGISSTPRPDRSRATTVEDLWEWDGTRWEIRQAPNGPGPRDHHAMAYDVARRRTVIYGGTLGTGQGWATGTWEWDGQRWHFVDASQPGPRGHHAMVYDSIRHRIVLFGGSDAGRSFGDTWTWDGAEWKKLSDEGPGPLSRHRLAFDTRRAVVVLHGGSQGRTDGAFASTETWELSGASWSRVAVDGPPRIVHAMTYDEARGVTVLYGGASDGQNTLDDVWEWDGRGWSPGVALAGAGVTSHESDGCATQEVEARTSHSLAYHASQRRVVMFGGSARDVTNRHPSSLWAWDGRRWTCLSSEAPPGRADAFLEYDRSRDRLVLFGGRRYDADGSVTFMTDTWEWDGRTWALRDRAGPAPRIHGAVAYDSSRKAILVHGGASQTGLLSDTWEWHGTAWREVPLALPFSGNANAIVETDGALMALGADRGPASGCGRLARARLFTFRGDSLADMHAPGPCFSQQAPTARIPEGLMLFAGWPADAAEPPSSWTWTTQWQRSRSSPTRRRGAAAAFDEARGRVVLFGGNDQTGVLGDTWEFDGHDWSRAMTTPHATVENPERTAAQDAAARPHLPKLHGEAISYDSEHDRLIVVGGRTTKGPLEGTWIWDREGWRRLRDASSTPPHRATHAMGYNPDTRQVFLFGGMTRKPATLLCDTWIFQHGAWRKAGAPVCLNGRSRHASLVYDSTRRTMLLVSGPAIAGDSEPRATEIWRWMGERWVLVDRSGPRREEFGSVAFDAERSLLVVPVLYAGPDQGTWEWDGTSWRRSTAARPSTRQTYGVTFDPRNRKVVLVGGQGSARGPYFDDVWTWDGRRWEETLTSGGFTGRAGGALVATRSGELLYAGGYDIELRGEVWTLGAQVWRRALSGDVSP
jgi:hypothetical protein